MQNPGRSPCAVQDEAAHEGNPNSDKVNALTASGFCLFLSFFFPLYGTGQSVMPGMVARFGVCFAKHS